METKTHTPGPWRYRELRTDANEPILLENTNVSIAHIRHSVGVQSTAERLANAELIASAPTMAARIAELEAALADCNAALEVYRPNETLLKIAAAPPVFDRQSELEAELADYKTKFGGVESNISWFEEAKNAHAEAAELEAVKAEMLAALKECSDMLAEFSPRLANCTTVIRARAAIAKAEAL